MCAPRYLMIDDSLPLQSIWAPYLLPFPSTHLSPTSHFLTRSLTLCNNRGVSTEPNRSYSLPRFLPAHMRSHHLQHLKHASLGTQLPLQKPPPAPSITRGGISFLHPSSCLKWPFSFWIAKKDKIPYLIEYRESCRSEPRHAQGESMS